MSNIIRIKDFTDPALDVYVRLTGAQLRNKLEPEQGIFIAESPTVIEVALSAGCEIVSMLTDERLLESASVRGIIDKLGDTPIYTASREVLTSLTGFELTRGSLAAMRRPREKTPDELLEGARRVAVLETVTDSTNIGALFRSAAALGIDAVLVTPDCCDPLCRRAVRVSMGTVFLVPWGRIGKSPYDPKEMIEELHRRGFRTAAMALSERSVSISDHALTSEERLAIILGTEGTGLRRETIEESDYTVKIPMFYGVDSLNVGAAGAVAFWQLCASVKEKELNGQ